MNTMIRLRWVAIGSNVLFILFGYFARIYPATILHIVLFPVNVIRLLQNYRLVQRAVHSASSGLSFESKALFPFMVKRQLKSGMTLVTKGDVADKLFYILEGKVQIVGLNKTLGLGTVIGEIGVFAPDRRRTVTVKCITDCIACELTERGAMELYFQNPSFGYAVLQLIISRLLENQQIVVAEQQSNDVETR
jgi:CRP-like cAMP-binding protein